jgi:hypothetical protein
MPPCIATPLTVTITKYTLESRLCSHIGLGAYHLDIVLMMKIVLTALRRERNHLRF